MAVNPVGDTIRYFDIWLSLHLSSMNSGTAHVLRMTCITANQEHRTVLASTRGVENQRETFLVFARQFSAPETSRTGGEDVLEFKRDVEVNLCPIGACISLRR